MRKTLIIIFILFGFTHISVANDYQELLKLIAILEENQATLGQVKKIYTEVEKITKIYKEVSSAVNSAKGIYESFNSVQNLTGYCSSGLIVLSRSKGIPQNVKKDLVNEYKAIMAQGTNYIRKLIEISTSANANMNDFGRLESLKQLNDALFKLTDLARFVTRKVKIIEREIKIEENNRKLEKALYRLV